MPIFTADKPVRTREPRVLVENQLSPGVYLFELVVLDNEGKQSAPALFEVRVVSGGRVIIEPPGGVVIRPPGGIRRPPRP